MTEGPVEPGEDPDWDESHFLAARPLDAAVDYCCAAKCYAGYDARSWSECHYLAAGLRERRQAELRTNPKLFNGQRGGFGGGIGSRCDRARDQRLDHVGAPGRY